MFVRILAYFMLFYSFQSSHGVRGMKLSKEDQLDWNKQFKHLRKPSIKTIQTRYGDIYDCVDFYKQPAFDHPLLKNHSFHPQMRPSIFPPQMNTTSGNNKIPLDAIKLEDGGCPIGTVPIRRISKDDFIRIKRFTEDYASRTRTTTTPTGVQVQPGTNLAVVQTKSNPGTTIYNGVGGRLTVYGLPIAPSQYSSGEMIVQNGNDRIQIGWTVNPTLNKDNQTRLFQYLDAGQSHCFNVLCPGFVSVRQDLPIDQVLGPVSVIGEPGMYSTFFIYQDPKNGNWWFNLNGDVIGFWPQQIFNGLKNSASYVAIGGETYSPPGQPFAPMGSGVPLEIDTTRSAHGSHLYVVDANYNYITPDQVEEYSSNDYYSSINYGYHEHWGWMIFYGKTLG